MADIPLKTRMRAWRASARLSQQDVADPLGWTRQAISSIEVGSRDICVADLAVICRQAFDTDLHTFFGPLPKTRRAA